MWNINSNKKNMCKFNFNDLTIVVISDTHGKYRELKVRYDIGLGEKVEIKSLNPMPKLLVVGKPLEIDNIPEEIHEVEKFKSLLKEHGIECDWFSIASHNKNIVDKFCKKLNKLNLVVNYPKTEATIPEKHTSEAYLEYLIEKNDIEKGIDFQGRQLPVGVFKGTVEKGNNFFTGGSSAVDLWAIKNAELSIYELKLQNKKLGIITETLFYIFLCRDIFVEKDFEYKIDLNEANYIRNFDKLLLAYNNNTIKNIRGVFLVDELHTNIKKETITFIDNLLGKLNMSLGDKYYSYDLESGKIEMK